MSSSAEPIPVCPDDLEPTIGISLTVQKQILRIHARLEVDDHYELLGVSTKASKEEIKTRYFELMAEFHTDRFFGKDVGRFGSRLDAITKKLNEVHATLTRRKRRDEYDNYLRSRYSTRSIRPSEPPEPISELDLELVAPGDLGPPPTFPTPSIARAPLTQSPTTQGVPPETQGPTTLQAPETQSPTTHVRKSAKSIEAARRRFQRKMRSGAQRRDAPAPQPKVDPSEVRQVVTRELRELYQSKANPEQMQAARYAQVADAASQKGDWAAAANAMKLAVEAAPKDVGYGKRLEEIQEKADAEFADQFLVQAAYEEQEGRFDRAARSFERAARGKKSAELFHKAAECFLRMKRVGDEEKRKLIELAREAVRLEPKNVEMRVTLCRSYQMAEMKKSADGELRRILEVAPDHPEAVRLRKEL